MRNKFLNRNVKPSSPQKTERMVSNGQRNYEILEEFAGCWSSLEEARKKLRRSIMYAFEDQWGDYVKDPVTGMLITESDLIKEQGKVPLKNNMISPIVNNIEGQFRKNTTQTVCTVRDQRETKVGEMMSIALEYASDLNELPELDSSNLKLLLCGGYVAQHIEYGFNPAKHTEDVWVYNTNPARLFFNTNMEDVRGWDLTHIGEVYDMPLDRVIANFAKNDSDKKRIEDIYGPRPSSYLVSDGMQGREIKDLTFYQSSRVDMCRVILGWKLCTREAYFCKDTLKGTWKYIALSEKKEVDLENERRIAEAAANGVAQEDVLLIEYKYTNEQYWYYWYLSPWGDVLQEGRSPYWHESHNYVLHVYPMIQGKVFNYIESFIDQQRAINRTMTLIDFIRSSSSKGLLVCDETAFEDMSRQEIVDQFVRYNGVLFARPKSGTNIENVIKQINGQAAVAGDYELLNIQLKLINDISGVNSAMQGKPAASGTAASLYAQQVENSSLNLAGLFDSFKAFRKRRDLKVVQTIQQFYDSARYIDLGGRDYSEESKYYNPEKAQGAQIDIKITDGGNTPSYQALINDFLMELWKGQAIGVKTMLENCSYPFAAKVLESIKRNEEIMAQGQPMQGVDMNAIQGGGNSALMQKLNNDSLAQPNDGIPQAA